MYSYKITTLFQPEWPALFASTFGQNVECNASTIEGNVATFSFINQPTVSNLGPLVKIEGVPTPETHISL